MKEEANLQSKTKIEKITLKCCHFEFLFFSIGKNYKRVSKFSVQCCHLIKKNNRLILQIETYVSAPTFPLLPSGRPYYPAWKWPWPPKVLPPDKIHREKYVAWYFPWYNRASSLRNFGPKAQLVPFLQKRRRVRRVLAPKRRFKALLPENLWTTLRERQTRITVKHTIRDRFFKFICILVERG